MTAVGDAMLRRSKPDLWGSPMWDESDVCAGGVQPGEAQLLYGLVRALKPEVVLEIGTSHGYSGLHLAQALADNSFGFLHTAEIDDLRREDAERNFEAAGLKDRALFYSKIPVLPRVDFAFLDAVHTRAAVQEYLLYVPDLCRVAAVHDATWQNHVAEAILGTNWTATFFPHTSYAGIAILTR